MRLTVDDVLREGRRRKRNRRAAWLSAAAAVAVAGVIVVPSLMRPPPRVPSTGLTQPGAFDGNIAPARVGNLEITGTTDVTRGFQVAVVTKAGGTGWTLGRVTLFGTGVLNPEQYLQGEPLEIGARPAKYVPSVRFGDADGPTGRAVVWEYAENAFALVTTSLSLPTIPPPPPSAPPDYFPRSLTKQEMIDVARAVRTTTPVPMTVGFHLTEIPVGYRLDSAGRVGYGYSELAEGKSWVRLVRGDFHYAGLAGPEVTPQVGGKPLPSIEILVSRAGEVLPENAGKTKCVPIRHCYRWTDDGKYIAEVRGVGVENPQLGEVIADLVFAGDDPATWTKASDFGG
jgi:hypothetical protein